MEQNTKQFESSIYPKGSGVVPIRENHPKVPTWGIVIFLFICFFVLKSFIYIKDEKRHGK